MTFMRSRNAVSVAICAWISTDEGIPWGMIVVKMANSRSIGKACAPRSLRWIYKESESEYISDVR